MGTGKGGRYLITLGIIFTLRTLPFLSLPLTLEPVPPMSHQARYVIYRRPLIDTELSTTDTQDETAELMAEKLVDLWSLT